MCTEPITIINSENEEVTVPCGKCLMCRKKRASDWTIKLINEAKYYNKVCFITLTFDNKILTNPESRGGKFGANTSFLWNIRYSKDYVTKFIKRLRKYYKNKIIRYFLIGEYGEKNKRPHYHLIIFGVNFDEDRVKAELSKTGKPQFFSQKLEDLWGAGRTRIQDVNSANIAYISQYSLKKMKVREDKETFYKNHIQVEYINSEGKIKTKWEYKYKPRMSFSNRGKFNKWIRKRPEQIDKGYLTDKDGHKYGVPRSYLRTLKQVDCIREKFINSLINYEEIIQNKLLETGAQTMLYFERMKEKVLQSKINKTLRADF